MAKNIYKLEDNDGEKRFIPRGIELYSFIIESGIELFPGTRSTIDESSFYISSALLGMVYSGGLKLAAIISKHKDEDQYMGNADCIKNGAIAGLGSIATKTVMEIF